MGKKRKIWTKEMCIDAAKKCETRLELRKKYRTIYNNALINKWMDEICSHMSFIPRLIFNGTKEDCAKIASTYSSKTAFNKGNYSVFNRAKKNGWLDEICSHMDVSSLKKNRLIYVYEFSDNSVYIGLTGNDKIRSKKHLKFDHNSSVYKHIEKSKLIPQKKIISDGYISVYEAQELEINTITKYRLNGWNVLNINKAGGLGGNIIKWTKEECAKIALNCNSRVEFSRVNSNAYIRARRSGWLDEICSHMVGLKIPYTNWTYNHCNEEAQKYTNRYDFSNKSSGAYKIATKNGWLNDVCAHMIPTQNPSGYWSYEKCKEVAIKCFNRADFTRKYGSAYNASVREGWLCDFFIIKKIQYNEIERAIV